MSSLTHEGEWITPAVERQPDVGVGSRGEVERHPTWWLRRLARLDELPERMWAEIVALGYYELYVNGERVGGEPLAPSVTKLDCRAFLVRHDITSHLRAGDNCVAIWCSSGWYLPHQFTVHEHWSPLLRVSVIADAAKEAWIASDAGWQCRESNRWVIGRWAWDQFGGEEVDAATYDLNWNTTDGDSAGWHAARVVSAPPVDVTERDCPPNRVGARYAAQRVRQLDDGRYEVDFGTCLAGTVDLCFPSLGAGERVTLQFYDLPADNDRKRDHSYNQRSVYVGAGDGEDRFVNRFNYAGFRYVTLDGLHEAPVLADMEAQLVETAMEPVGSFRCSNELFNRIHNLNVHTLR